MCEKTGAADLCGGCAVSVPVENGTLSGTVKKKKTLNTINNSSIPLSPVCFVSKFECNQTIDGAVSHACQFHEHLCRIYHISFSAFGTDVNNWQLPHSAITSLRQHRCTVSCERMVLPCN